MSDSGLGCGPGGSGTEAGRSAAGPRSRSSATRTGSSSSPIGPARRRRHRPDRAALLARLQGSEGPPVGEARHRRGGSAGPGRRRCLGGLTVEHSLEEELVAAHLGLAMILLGLLLWLGAGRARPRWSPGRDPAAPDPRPEALRGHRDGPAPLRDRRRRLHRRHRGGGRERGRAKRHRSSSRLREAVPGCGNGKFLPFGNNRLTDIHLTHRAFVYAATSRSWPCCSSLSAGIARPAWLAIAGLLLVGQGAARRAQRLARRARPAGRRPPDDGDPALDRCPRIAYRVAWLPSPSPRGPRPRAPRPSAAAV